MPPSCQPLVQPYAAPELLSYKTYSAQVDVLSYAMTLYECLVGQIPFHE